MMARVCIEIRVSKSRVVVTGIGMAQLLTLSVCDHRLHAKCW